MKKLATIILLVLAIACKKERSVTAVSLDVGTTASTASTSTMATTATTSTTSPAAGPAIVLSAAVPGDALFGPLPSNPTMDQKLLAIQGDFDIYSWNTFIALNWPPGPDGKGGPNSKIGQNGDNDTVWEHYRDVSDVFLPGGAMPS